MNVSDEEKFKRWVEAPLDKLRKLPHGDGALGALSICCGLFERFIDSVLKKKGVKASPEAFREAAAKDLGCSEEAIGRFWDGFRLGMQHAFHRKSYVQDAGHGDRWGWEMAEADGFHHYPEIIKTSSHAFIVRIDPWKFVSHVLERWRQNPHLMNALSEFVLGDVAPIIAPTTESSDPSTYSSPEHFRTYYEGPPPPSVTGASPEGST